MRTPEHCSRQLLMRTKITCHNLIAITWLCTFILKILSVTDWRLWDGEGGFAGARAIQARVPRHPGQKEFLSACVLFSSYDKATSRYCSLISFDVTALISWIELRCGSLLLIFHFSNVATFVSTVMTILLIMQTAHQSNISSIQNSVMY